MNVKPVEKKFLPRPAARRRAMSRSVSYTVDLLERRTMLSSIAGVVWQDRNGNGVRESVEPGLGGRTVYIDANDNGLLDVGESSRISGTDGSYSFANLPAKIYVLRQIASPGSRETAITGRDVAQRLNVAAGQSATGVSFGSAPEAVSAAQRVTPADIQPGDWSGGAVAMSGNIAVVSSLLDDIGSTADAGSAYIYERNASGAWIFQTKLAAPAVHAADTFGNQVAIDGDNIVIAAAGDDEKGTDAGAAYVFHCNGSSWEYKTKLVAADGAAGDAFGTTLSISQGVIVVGAWADDDLGNESGSLFIFSQNLDGTWSQTQKLHASNGATNDGIGGAHTVIKGNLLVSGAVGSDPRGESSGSIYVFEKTESGLWTERANLFPSAGAANDRFSYGLDINESGSVIAVGADGFDARGGDSGRVFIFRRDASNNWASSGTGFEANDTTAGDFFGVSLAFAGDELLVSASGQDGIQANSGAVYTFRDRGDGTWSQGLKFVANQQSAGDYKFGSPIATAGEYFVVGAPLDDSPGIDAGAAYFFKFQNAAYIAGTTWNDRNADGIRDAGEPIVAGRTVYLDADDDGVLDTGETRLVSDANGAYEFTNLVPGTYAIRQIIPTGWTTLQEDQRSKARRITVAAGATVQADIGSTFTVVSASQKLLAPGGVAGDQFGWQDAQINGEWAIVGAHQADGLGSLTDSGAAYVYHQDSEGQWVFTQKLTAPDAAAGDHFGLKLQFEGNRLFVGAPDDDDFGINSGSVYRFQLSSNTWTFHSKLYASDAAAGDSFGRSIGFDGSTLAIGAPFRDDGATDTGKLYVFERDAADDWNEVARVRADDPVANDQLGVTNAVVNGSTIVVAAEFKTANSIPLAGAVYLFERASNGSWSQSQRLTAPAGTQVGANGFFGHNGGLALQRDLLAIGHLGENTTSGAVYLYRHVSNGAWSQIGTVVAADASGGDAFGRSLALSGNTLVVGSYQDDNEKGADAGGVYIFREAGDGSWRQVSKLVAPDGVANQKFGQQVLFDGRGLLITSEQGGAYPDQGSAYTYKLSNAAYVSGFLFNDADKNGNQNNGELALAGWTVYLDANSNGFKDTGELTAVTDAAGYYHFDDLIPGKYTIRVVQQDEWSQTTPAGGTGWVMALSSAEVIGHRDFGLVNQATIVNGIIWNDRNADGVRQASTEPLLSGRTVWWDVDEDGALDAGEPSAVTDSSGAWAIRNILPGDRLFQQIAPAGWRSVLTSPTGFSRRVTVQSAATTSGTLFGQARSLLLQRRLVADLPNASAAFGTVSVSDNYAAIGATGEGRVYIFKKTLEGGWYQTAVLSVPSGKSAANFGGVIAISGNTVVVGSVAGSSTGVAYVYQKQLDETWALTTTLSPSTGEPGEEFGTSVAIDGDRIAIGSPYSRIAQGTIYIYERDGAAGNWTERQNIYVESNSEQHRLTNAGTLSISGDYIIAGAEFRSNKAFIFHRRASGFWEQSAILNQPGAGYSSFGGAVLIQGDLAIVMSRGPNYVHTFRRAENGTWPYVQTFGPDGGDGSFVGAMTADANHFWVSASGNGGLVYEYNRNAAGLLGFAQKILPASDVKSDDGFGATLSAADGRLLIGSPAADFGAQNAGAAYIYGYSDTLPSYLRGTAFDDANKNGARDAGESAVAGRTIYLDSNDNGVKDTGEISLVTDASGFYEFADLVPGSYIVRLVQVDETSQTAPAFGAAYRVTLTSGQTYVGDFGTVNTATVVSGIVWNDRNADGVRQADVEPLLSGRTVFWDANDNALFDTGEKSAVSDSSGVWSIWNVLPGTRAFRQIVPAHWKRVSVTGSDTARRVLVASGQVTATSFGSLSEVVYLKQKLAPATLSSGDRFGTSVAAASGSTVAVGAFWQDAPTDSGAVYVYDRATDGTLTQSTILRPANRSAGDEFGVGLAMDGTRIAVGARFGDGAVTNAGLIYIYERQGNSWAQTATIQPTDALANDTFGWYLSLQGNRLIATAPQAAGNRGAVYIFEFNGSIWQQKAKLTTSDGQPGDQLGIHPSLSEDGTQLVVGAMTAAGESGAVYIFSKGNDGTWAQKQKLTAADPSSGVRFGQYSVQLDGAIVVSSHGEGSQSGAAYVFRRNASGLYMQTAKIKAPDPQNDSYFSHAIAKANDSLYFGVPSFTGQVSHAGATYKYGLPWDGASLAYEGKFFAPDEAVDNSFGGDMSADSRQLFITAFLGDSATTNNTGAVYVYNIDAAAYLRGAAFQDIDNDGVRDVGEPGNPNWTVYLDTNDNGIKDAGEPTQITDATGFYEFGDLLPGNYVVRQVSQPLWTQTTPGSNQPYRVTLVSGQTRIADFGLYASASVTGIVFSDQNNNGIKDGTDAPLANWVVFADLDGDRVLDDGEPTAITLADGSYQLTDLPIRSLRIDVVDGALWGITPRTAPLTTSLVISGQNFGSQAAFGQTFGSSGSLGGRVAVDTDGSGEVEVYETNNVAAVRFNVFRDDGDGVFEPNLNDVAVGTTTTSSGGLINMPGLPVGTYWLQLDESSSGMAGYSLFGRAAVRRGVVSAQKPAGVVNFSVLQAYTVNTLVDEIPGSNTPAHLSLREALDLVRTGGKNTSAIIFDPSLAGGTIDLDANVGQLLVLNGVSIIGPTAAPLTIRSAGAGRVMSISSGVSASLRDLAFTGGSAATGGAVTVGFGGTLNAERVTFQGNSATQRGGAIYASSGSTISLVSSIVSDNNALISGGAIYLGGEADLTLSNVTLASNAATGSSGDGGAIYSLGTITAVGTTLSANTAARGAGGIYAAAGSIKLTNDTLTLNKVMTGAGGGVTIASGVSANLVNTIVAGNLRGSAADDISGGVDAVSHHNLIGTPATGISNATNGNLIGTAAAPLDPRLMPLANYGGLVPTHALRFDSPATDAGSNAAVIAIGTTNDAAGNARLRDFDADTVAIADMGAFEAAPIITIDALLDESTDTDGKTSLREAVARAAARPGFDAIRVSAALMLDGAVTIPLTGGEIVLDGNISIQGRSDGRVMIDALQNSRLFRVASSGSAIISDLTLRGGNAAGGGGIRNEGALVLERSLLTGNQSSTDGGAIWSSGSLVMTNTTLSANAATNRGAGLFASSGTVAIANATVLNNAVNSGALPGGGGIFVAPAGSVRLVNTVVAGNKKGATPDDVAGTFNATSAFNFIGAIDGGTNLNGTGSQYGSIAAPADPRLTALADHGGPTFTHALQPASPVTDAGNDAEAALAALTTDARGQSRIKDGNDDGVARVDIGAVEQQFPLNQAPTLTTMSPIGGAVESVPFTLTYDALRLASNAADPEGEAIGFRIESILAGSFTLNGVPVIAGQTVLTAGNSLIWTLPTEMNFGTAASLSVGALTVRAFDGVVPSVTAPVAVNLTVRTVAAPINYALLFSGGDRVELNYSIYYDNLKRMYGVLINQYGLRPEDIYVVYADGRNTAPDQKGGINSDMSFATSNVLSATRTNLKNTLQTIAGKADANDHFLFWTFDHGLGSTNRPSEVGEEVIKGWGSDQVISDKELRVWTQGLDVGDSPAAYSVPAGYGGVRSGFNTYHFAQCFSGGMLDDFQLGPTSYGGVNYGMASSNHYEASYADYFAAPFVDALALGYNSTAAAYRYAVSNDSHALASAANAGAWAFNVEHPWSIGPDFSIFATTRNQNAAPELRSIAPLRIAPTETDLSIGYDQLVAASDGTDPTGQALVFQVTGLSVGMLLRNGVQISPANITQTTIKFGEAITWRRTLANTGTISALSVRLVANDGATSASKTVPIRVGSPAGLTAVDDAKTIQINTLDTPLALVSNDVGVGARVLRVGVPAHGKATFDATSGQVRYTPAADYLGTDRFSYLVTDGANTDLATVTVNVVSYDPTQQQTFGSAFDATRYKLTELAPPPGWAALPTDDPTNWSWAYRQTVPAWTTTRGVDLSDDGVVIVKVSRPNVAGNALDYVGSTDASYRWQSGDVAPYWNTNATGSVAASNAQLLLLETEFTHNGRKIYNGIDALSTGNPAVLPTARYLDPDNGNEVGFPAVGGIYYDVGAGSSASLWDGLPEDVYPVAVSNTSSNSAEFLGIVNRVTAASGSQAARWSFSRDGSHQFGATLAGAGGSHRSSANAIDNAGHVVGWAEYAPSDYHAFYYGGSSMMDIGALPGFVESTATALNNAGQVVGYSASNIGSTADARAFLWTATTGSMTALGTLGGSGWSVARDVSSTGTIVGASNGRAFVWSAGTMYDLNALVDELPSGVTLTSADGINRNGQIIATGTGPGGVTRAYFVDLAASVVGVNDLVPATNRAIVGFNPLANDRGARSVVSVNRGSLQGNLVWDAAGNFTFDPATAFNDLAVGQTRATSFTYRVDDGRGGTSSATVTVSVVGAPLLSTFYVSDPAVTTTGFAFTLSNPLDLSKLNLYDGQDLTVDLPDVSVTNASGANVRGSLVWEAPTNTLRFVASGGTLDAGTYTVRLAGRADGIFNATLGALDGDGNNTAGGDYVHDFTVAAADGQARRVTLPDVARGPGQAFELPITLDNGAGVRAVDFELHFDPTLLTLNTATLGAALPSGWTLTSNLAVSAGVARFSLFSTAPLAAGAVALLKIGASVPLTAGYRATDLLSITSLKLNEDLIKSRGDAAIHKVAYAGDVTGNGGYSGLDASRVARVAAALDSGFDPYALVDPTIVADVTGDGTVSAFDASDIAQMAAGLAPPSILAIPAGAAAPTIAAGPDPTVALGSATIAPGGAGIVQATITDDARGLQAFDFVLRYDATRFTAANADVSLGALLNGGGWTIIRNVDAVAGKITVTAYSATQVAGPSAVVGSILTFAPTAKTSAVAGSSSLHLDASSSLNEGELSLTALDGVLTIGSATPLAIVASAFLWDAPKPTLVVTFDQAVQLSTLDASDFVIVDRVTGLAVSIGKTLTYDAATRRASIVLQTGGGVGALVDGRYQLRIAAGSISAVGSGIGGTGGAALGGAHALDFFSLSADANHDGTVDFNDLVTLAQNYQSTGRSFSQGNFDYDAAGKVDFDDLVILAQRYLSSQGSALQAFQTLTAPPVVKVAPARKTKHRARGRSTGG